LAQEQGQKATIAVLARSNFLPDRTGLHRDVVVLPDILASRIIEHLANSNRFIPVEREALRKVVMEQRFGRDLQKSYVDKTLDKAIQSMDQLSGEQKVEGTEIGASAGPIGMNKTNALEPKPVGSGLHEGKGSTGATGALADYNDILHDFQDLGSAVGADYLVLGNLEKLKRQVKATDVPYSTKGRQFKQKTVDARLRLRVIDAEDGTVAEADSFRVKMIEDLFEGKEIKTDAYSAFDSLGRIAAVKILDMTFPARIVNEDPLLVSRGRNDGVEVGDILQIEREGKEITDQNGVVIARLKSEVGFVKITKLQETIAFVQPISGNGFSKGDLASLQIEETSSSERAPSPQAAPVKRLAEKGSSAAQIPSVAVGIIKSGATGTKDAQQISVCTDTLISRLTQTKRFQVVDRQEVDQLLDEQLFQSLGQNTDMPSAVGTLKGVDYLVYGNLDQSAFTVEEEVRQLPGSKRSFKTKMGYVSGNMRIVDVHTGDVLESRKISVQQRLGADLEGSRLLTILADAYAEQVVLLLMNAIYPIKVAAVGSDGTVYINRGNDGGLSQGEILDAYAPGEPVIDPDTGVQLGVEEIHVGKVVVDSVQDARSKGTLVSGSDLSRGDILKRTLDNKEKRTDSPLKSKPSRSGPRLSEPQKTQVKPPTQSNPTLAVGLIKLNPGARTTGFGQAQLIRMTNVLIGKLSNTGRFQLMERQEVDQVLDEKAFEATAHDADMRDYLRELQGADYLIHGEMANFYTVTEKKQVPYLDAIETYVTGVADGTLRIVDVHQGKVIAADQVRLRKEVKEEDPTQVMTDLMDRFSTQAVKNIVTRIYPVKLLGQSSDGTLYINRGADVGIKQGQIFDLMRPEQALVDSDSGQSFGQAESMIGKVKVTSVEPNRARARLIDAQATPQKGDTLRNPRIPQKKEPKVQQPSW
jgi:curli biogenesis system outer membrane secretion channel CsgG